MCAGTETIDKFNTNLIFQTNVICFQCDMEGEVEYEFPIYNHTETLEGLWDPGDPRYSESSACYGGVRLYTSPGTYHLFKSIFPHIQVWNTSVIFIYEMIQFKSD